MGAAIQAYLGLGANLGDRLATLREAVALLGVNDQVTVTRSSRVYETTPVGVPSDQPDYLNAVVAIETSLDAHELLAACRSIEVLLGRVREERWGPRTIDIDLLTYGREEIATDDLTVPHPRMHERMFVLAPLLELDADPPLPGGRHAADMRLEVADPFGVRPVAPPLVAGEAKGVAG